MKDKLETLDLNAIRERCDRADQVVYVNWRDGDADAQADMETLIVEVYRLRAALAAAQSAPCLADKSNAISDPLICFEGPTWLDVVANNGRRDYGDSSLEE